MRDKYSIEPSIEENNKIQKLYEIQNFFLLENETKELIKKYPSSANLMNILGVSLQAQKKYKESIEAYKKSIHLKPDLYLAYFNLGNTLKKVLDLNSAEKNYKKCLNINPNYIEGYIGLGLIQLDLNKLNESISTFTQAIKIQPLNAVLHRHLSDVKKYLKEDEHMKEMKKIILDVDSSSKQKMHLSFALGKAYEDIGSYQKAFNYWEKGNALKRKEISYSTKKNNNLKETLKIIFTKDLFEKFKNCGNDSEKIIFILGMPRSGTTLIQQILSSHPDVMGLGESTLFSNIIKKSLLEKDGSINKNLYSKDKVFFNEVGKDFILKAKKEFSIFDINNNSKIISVKEFDFCLIGFIKLIFPQAKIIHTIRNPLDNCISLFKNLFEGGVDFSYNLIELGEYYNFYSEIMNFWENTLPKSFKTFNYEEVVNNKEKEVKKMLEYCDLQWNENCMQSHKFIHSMSTGTNSINIHQPMYKSSIQYWKKYEEQLKPLIEIIKI